MSRFVSIITVIFLFTIIFTPGIPAQEDATWTYMVYMSGDSSLAASIPDDIQEMKEVGSGGGLEIIVLSDSSGMDDSRLSRILPGQQEVMDISLIDPAWGSELEMGSADTLSKFVIWTADNYPSDRYVLDLWGHGTGWGGVCPDKGNYLECQELREAFVEISDAGVELDIISMDACQMGMVEIAYELRDMADFAMLSQKDVPLDGWPYDRLLAEIKENPRSPTDRIGRLMIDRYMEWGLVNSRYSLTLALIDLSEMHGLGASFDIYSRMAANMTGYFNQEFQEARDLTEEYDGLYQYDMRHLVANMGDRTECRLLQELGEEVDSALERVVAYERHWTNVQDESAEHAAGLSVWFPIYRPSPDYLKCGFARDTGWDEFVAGMYPYFSNPTRQGSRHIVSARAVDQDGNSLKDGILLEYQDSPEGLTRVDIYGPNREPVDSFHLDSDGEMTIYLEAFGTYSVAFYLWHENGTLLNYTLFDSGIAKEGVSIIRGKVTSELGRGMAWVRVALVDQGGKILASTNTDSSGEYRLEVIVPTITDGSNLTLVCGLGDYRQNATIGMLGDTNTIDFRLGADHNTVEWLGYAAGILVVCGLLSLLIGALPRRKEEKL